VGTDEALATQLALPLKWPVKSWQMPMEESWKYRPSWWWCCTLQAVRQRNPWAHLIYRWTEKENGYNSPGATGYGVHTAGGWVTGNVRVAAPPQ